MRETGFYWVKQFGEWQVAKFDGQCWHFAEERRDGYQDGHCHTSDRDKDLQEIDEHRLTPPDRCPPDNLAERLRKQHLPR